MLAIGNAIVDVLADADDELLARHDLVKGSMELIDADRADVLYAAMPPGIEASGGSAANTAVGVASFGGRAAFIGKVRDDQLGAVFTHDIRAAGVAFDSTPATSGPPTARCLILVTPDAERTMSTSLGVAVEVSVDDIDEALVGRAAVTFCEGYLWDNDDTKAAIRHAMAVAQNAGRQVSLTLSDGFCVDRHRDEFLHELMVKSVDVLFSNEDEITSLYQVDTFDDALQRVRAEVPLAFLTRGAAGSVVVRGDELHVVDAVPVKVVDTTGAGDAYAAGALHGLTTGRDLATCARLGSVAASEVISHMGPRPHRALRELAATVLDA